jgi:hypothetical protein
MRVKREGARSRLLTLSLTTVPGAMPPLGYLTICRVRTAYSKTEPLAAPLSESRTTIVEALTARSVRKSSSTPKLWSIQLIAETRERSFWLRDKAAESAQRASRDFMLQDVHHVLKSAVPERLEAQPVVQAALKVPARYG